MDICQPVLGSFLVRVASGQFELNRPEELIGLLMKMTRNTVVRQVRRLRAQRRDDRRNHSLYSLELEETRQPWRKPDTHISPLRCKQHGGAIFRAPRRNSDQITNGQWREKLGERSDRA